MKRRILAAVAVLGLVAAGCGGDDDDGSTGASTTTGGVAVTAPSSTAGTSTTAAGVTSTAVAAQPALVDVTLTGGSEAEGYTYEATFPTVTGLADAAVQQSVNDRTRAEVTAAIDEFVASVEEFDSPPSESGALSGLRANEYQVNRLDAGLLSFRLPVSRYFAGAAHPGTVLLTFTYDLRTGERLALADLFVAGSPYLDRLSELSRQLLLAQPGFDQMPEFVTPGTEPKAENFAGFTVTDQDLRITFSEYQVGPYALGMPHVSIPFASLRTVLDPAGPLAIHN